MTYLNYCNPIVIVYALTVFICVLKIKEHNFTPINVIASYAFGTYLITDGIVGPLFLYKYMHDIYENDFALGLFLTVLVFIICMVIDYIRERITSPAVLYLTNKLQRIYGDV